MQTKRQASEILKISKFTNEPFAIEITKTTAKTPQVITELKAYAYLFTKTAPTKEIRAKAAKKA